MSIANFKVLRKTVNPTLITSASDLGDILCAPAKVHLGPIGLTGEIVGLTVTDNSSNAAELDVCFLNGDSALGTPGSAPNVTAAQLGRRLLRTIRVNSEDYRAFGSHRVADVEAGSALQVPGGQLYLTLIDREGGNTWAATDIELNVYIRVDDPR